MTMAATAAVTELGNAPGFEEATPAAPIEAQETEAAVETGTEAAVSEPTETEPEPSADPLAAVSDDAIFNHPKVIDRLRKEAESVRQKAERATETRIQSARADWVASDQALNDIASAIDAGNAQQAKAYLGAALANRDWQALGTIERYAREALPQGSTLSVEDAASLEDARRQGADALATAIVQTYGKAYAENVLRPEIEAKVAKDNAAKAKSAAKTAEIKGAESTNAEAGRPTLGVPGAGAATTGMTSAELEAMPSEVWRMKPQDERTRLLAEARANDARAR